MNRFIRTYLAFAMIAITVLLAACDGPARVGALEFGIEPTATPVPTPTLTPTPSPAVETYTNDEYGFAFDYLSTWTLSEEPHLLRLWQEDLQLTIGYRWATETASLESRSGMPAGDLIYNAKIVFLGKVIPGHTLEYERKAKAVFYGESGRVEAGDLQFSLHLGAPDTLDYEALDIPEQVQAEVKALLESFRRTEATGQPPAPSPTPPPVPTPTATTGSFEEGSDKEGSVVGWYGSVHTAPAGSGYDDYLSVLPELVQVGLAGLSPAVEDQIAELRDKEPPNKHAHFWGTLTCGVDDYNGCRLEVTHLRPDGPGPIFNPDPVEGWEGTIITDSAWAQIDDVFVLAGEYPVHYGIWSEYPALAARLAGYRNSGIPIRVWGQLTCGVPDANGCQIEVSRLEEASSSEASTTAASEEVWASYENEAYGFSFQYPATWTLEEAPGRKLDTGGQPAGAAPARCADAVLLHQGEIEIAVHYAPARPPADGPVAWCELMVLRDATDQDTVQVMGREALRAAMTDQGAVKAVFVSYVNEEADLIVQITLRDTTETAYTAPEMKALPQRAVADLELILSSFERIE